VLLDIFRLQDIIDIVVTVIFLRGSRVCDPLSIDDELVRNQVSKVRLVIEFLLD
jgi:hypothetical protein